MDRLNNIYRVLSSANYETYARMNQHRVNIIFQLNKKESKVSLHMFSEFIRPFESAEQMWNMIHYIFNNL